MMFYWNKAAYDDIILAVIYNHNDLITIDLKLWNHMWSLN